LPRRRSTRSVTPLNASRLVKLVSSNDAGPLRFAEDIYRHDTPLDRALAAATRGRLAD
jgi:hypothetical protein